jgi:hypothetical protein
MTMNHHTVTSRGRALARALLPIALINTLTCSSAAVAADLHAPTRT